MFTTARCRRAAAAVMARRRSRQSRQLGATIVRANMPTAGWIGGPGTEIAILNRNRESRDLVQPVRRPLVFIYELKHDLNLYLRDWATETAMRSLADIVAFNEAHAEQALRFGQDLFLAAAATRGDLSELEYLSARQMDLRSARTLGPRRLYGPAPARRGAVSGGGGRRDRRQGRLSERAGPGRLCRRRRTTPEYPFGVTFTGRAWSEPTLLRLAYAFEQATQARRPPPLTAT